MLFIGIGLVCSGYGIYMTIIRILSPEKLGKYEAMKRQFGDTAGKILHVIFYSVLPLLFGFIMIVQGAAVFSK
jgi:hypothetical protein